MKETTITVGDSHKPMELGEVLVAGALAIIQEDGVNKVTITIIMEDGVNKGDGANNNRIITIIMNGDNKVIITIIMDGDNKVTITIMDGDNKVDGVNKVIITIMDGVLDLLMVDWEIYLATTLQVLIG